MPASRLPSHRDVASGALTLELLASAEQVSVARREVVEVGRAAGLPELALRDVALAVSEACANVVVHAYVGSALPPQERSLRVRAHGADGALEVEICDHGTGMRARDDSPGLGLGLPLMAALTSALHVGSAPGGGTLLRLAFPGPGDAGFQRTG